MRESVGIYRELAATRPDAFWPDLAVVACQPGAPAGATGVGGRRRWPGSRRPSPSTGELAAARPDAFRPDLARSLNNQALRLRDLGRADAALAAMRGVRRHLPGAGRGAAGTRSATWPMSLDILSDRLSDLGRAGGGAGGGRGGGRHHPRGAAVARRTRSGPTGEVYLTNQTTRLSASDGRRRRWLRSRRPSAVHRELAAARPDAVRPDLATSLATLAPAV